MEIKKHVQQELDLCPPYSTYLGIDASLTKTGVARVVPGVIHTWNFVPGDKIRGVSRLNWYDDQFDQLLDMGVTAVCVEGYSHGSGYQAHQLGELGGLLRLKLWRRRIPAYAVPPQTLKKFTTGKGSGPKSVIALHLHKRWGLTVEQEDQADAAAAGLACVAKHTGNFSGLTKPQIEALAKMTAICDGPAPVRTRRRLYPGTKNP